MLKAFISKILIIAGCLCIAVAAGYEVLSYPWNTLRNEQINEIELKDPAPPDFEYVNYAAMQDSLEDFPTPAYPQALPGEVEPEIEPQPETAAEQPSDLSSYILLGVVKIPRINISENLFEGTGKQMDYGIGHVMGSALPGAAGNAVIAAHRVNSFGKQPFRYLDKMKNGDIITIKFGDITYTYEVFDTFIVTKSDVWVMAEVDGEPQVLTLITCDPVIASGNRLNRLIVRARLTLIDGLAPEPNLEEEAAFEDPPEEGG